MLARHAFALFERTTSIVTNTTSDVATILAKGQQVVAMESLDQHNVKNLEKNSIFAISVIAEGTHLTIFSTNVELMLDMETILATLVLAATRVRVGFPSA